VYTFIEYPYQKFMAQADALGLDAPSEALSALSAAANKALVDVPALHLRLARQQLKAWSKEAEESIASATPNVRARGRLPPSMMGADAVCVDEVGQKAMRGLVSRAGELFQTAGLVLPDTKQPQPLTSAEWYVLV
jgi:hypothetical protein